MLYFNPNGLKAEGVTMETIALNVKLRNESGKGAARKIRAEQNVPGIFYGPKMKDALKLEANKLEFAKVIKQVRGNSIIKLNGEGELDGKLALLKEVQVHPVTDIQEHFDLYEIKEGETFKLSMAIQLTGKPKGVAEGGKLQQLRRKIDIKCMPKDIPSDITIDVSDMAINETLHVKDIGLPDGVSILGTANFAIASVVTPEKEDKKSEETEDGAAATPAS